MPKRKYVSQSTDYKSTKKRKQRREEVASTSRFVCLLFALSRVDENLMDFIHMSASNRRFV